MFKGKTLTEYTNLFSPNNFENNDGIISRTINVGQWYYQNVQYVVVKNLDLLNTKKQKGLLSKLGIKTPLSKIPILGDILF